MSLRPERHLTKDGETPLPPHRIGRRVTSLKARMFNNLYLAEVNFWRDYLCQGKPRLILDFGPQSAIVDARLLTFGVEWPGVPGDDISFKNETYDDDLFTLSDLARAIRGAFDWEEMQEDAETDESVEVFDD
jgi:hypothetical protein